ncbi:hypothetical protein QAD02_015906 [Eretmocerus hayati]|uniref:Uncharacterized protein n=1 Tax=Eretmocerus hayati TaxID=131215 RepID=A0ACC2PC01_9HYME|nr:hypothetical protein QAD02_015906 [Eretmocerus hayati]
MGYNGNFLICLFIGTVFSTFWLESSSESIACNHSHLSIELPFGKNANLTELNVSISFDNRDAYVHPESPYFATFSIQRPVIYVVGKADFDESEDHLIRFDSTWLDGTSQYDGIYINGSTKYGIYKESEGPFGICNASLVDQDSAKFKINTSRLVSEDPEDGKRLIGVYSFVGSVIKKCLHKKLCPIISQLAEDKVKEVDSPSTTSENPTTPVIESEGKEGDSIDTSEVSTSPPTAIEDDVKKDQYSKSQSEGSEEDSGESPEEKTEEVNMSVLINSIREKLNPKQSNSSSVHVLEINLPAISMANLSCENGTFVNLLNIQVRGEVDKIEDTSRGVRVAVPLRLQEADAHYDCSYEMSSTNKYSNSVSVKAMQLKFRAILVVKKVKGESGEELRPECKSSVERVITLHPGKLSFDSEESSGEDVTFPLQKLIENAWELETILEVENELHGVLGEKLLEIQC